MARVAEELAVPRRIAAVRAPGEAGPHEPAVRPGGWLVDAADTAPANWSDATLAHGSSGRKRCRRLRACMKRSAIAGRRKAAISSYRFKASFRCRLAAA